jgi:hypothetical protein
MHNMVREQAVCPCRGGHLALFLNLYMGHLLGDFLFQPGRLVAAKRDRASGLLLHVGIVGASTALVLVGTIGYHWPILVLVCGTHILIEEITILAYVRTPTRPLYTFILDQSLHVLSMALLVWLWGEWQVTVFAVSFGVRMTTVQLASLCALGTATLFGSVFVFEAGNTVLEGNESKGRLLRLDWPRLGGMAERGVAIALAVAVHPALVVVPFIPRVVWAVLKTSGRDRSRNLIEAAAGLGVCVASYLGVIMVAVLVGGAFAAPGVWLRPLVL